MSLMAYHGGNVRQLARIAQRSPEELLDFSANINPLGPPGWLRVLINSKIDALTHYPDPECTEFVTAAAQRFGVAVEELLPGNGSAEILHVLPRAVGAKRPLPAGASGVTVSALVATKELAQSTQSTLCQATSSGCSATDEHFGHRTRTPAPSPLAPAPAAPSQRTRDAGCEYTGAEGAVQRTSDA